MPRSRLALALALALAGAPGCFLNEIDKGMAQYEKNAPKSARAGSTPGPEASARPGAAKSGAAPAPAGPSWWETAKTLASEPRDETIAACAIGGRVEYQRRDDCLARGGQPQ